MTITAERTTSTINPRTLIPYSLYSRLVARIVTDEQVDQAYAERIMDQALGFLMTCAVNPGAGLSPSETVDIGWHTFILHTREYADFCQQVAGRFIHHAPADTPSGSSKIQHAIDAMAAAGVPVDAELWTSTGRCSQCHDGCVDSP